VQMRYTSRRELCQEKKF